MANRKQERRKQLVVNKSMQSRLIANMALMPAIALAGIAVFTGFYVKGITAEAIATDSALPEVMPLFYLVIVFELLAAVFLAVNSLKISHQVAGPALRLCQSIAQMRDGNLTGKVTLRRGDMLGEIGDELNQLLDYLNENPPPGARTRAMTPHDAAAGRTGGAAQQTPATAGTPLLPIANEVDTAMAGQRATRSPGASDGDDDANRG